MKKIDAVLGERFKQQETSKIKALAEKSARAPSFAPPFPFEKKELSMEEKKQLRSLLERYGQEDCDTEADFHELTLLTLEVKAISNQAILLHGERVKKARILLKNYKEGAFSSWLTCVYGNRQTPYNFLQYFEFYIAVSKEVQPLVESLPRQAIYSLASRQGPLEKKMELIKEASGKSKKQILHHIRENFPTASKDKRTKQMFYSLANSLQRASEIAKVITLSKKERLAIEGLVKSLRTDLGML